MWSLSRRAVLAGLAVSPFAVTAARAQTRPELLIYCGITMVKPVKELADLFEARTGVKVTLSQGGSEDLYDALKMARVGDIYFPGSDSFRKNHLAEGFLGDATLVAHNVAALMVAKGNPKGVKPEVRELLRPDLAMVVCNPDTGSIGAETQKILDRAGLTEQVLTQAAFLATDSRNLTQAIKGGRIDVTLNWRATAFFPENRDAVEVVDLDTTVSQPARLEFNLLTFSSQAEAARRFVALAASAEGQVVFRKHGFLDASLKGDY